MNVTLLQKYIQITVEEESDFLHKALAYAEISLKVIASQARFLSLMMARDSKKIIL